MLNRHQKTVGRHEIGMLREPLFEAQDSSTHCSRGAQLHWRPLEDWWILDNNYSGIIPD